jgi:2-amino-4-hydroxy-6-hydroxymethyldihydropteridine diphosphokinase
MTTCLISFGANIPGPLGYPSETLNFAIKEFQYQDLLIIKKSQIYSSPAFPDPKKPEYLNGCLQILVNCGPNDVLCRLKVIEKKMGRRTNHRWGSRICDLDLLSFESKVLPSSEIFNRWYRMPLKNQLLEKPDELLLPHPRIQDRAFVLKPLLDVAAGWMHPVHNLTVKEMFNFLPKEERDAVKEI